LSGAAARFSERLAELDQKLEVRAMDQSTHTAEDAAHAIGCPIGAIVKSLLFLADDEPLLILVSGPNRVDTKSLEQRLGVRLAMADAKRVKRETGYSIGAVPPFGHPSPLATLVDETLLGFDRVWAAAGSQSAVFGISPAALMSLSHGRTIAIS
jgi:prolyl-tRNA editing enzyme YbaK/EbsC (Cys-tRNA(Pro) deacylase)